MEEYEVENGLLGIMRDVWFKLSRSTHSIEKIKSVLFSIFFIVNEN
jgi:hypothetical protein